MDALCSRASRRKRANRPLSSSAAPSQEKTTNWGGRWPGRSGSRVGWFGCGPVSEVEPSPIRVTGGLAASVGVVAWSSAGVAGTGAGVVACPPSGSVRLAQPAARLAAPAAPAASRVRRERASMVTPFVGRARGRGTAGARDRPPDRGPVGQVR